MSIATIRKRLANYLKIADEKKLKAIYTMVEDEIDTRDNDWDDAFVKELNERSKTFENGAAKTYSWDETKKAAIKRSRLKKG